jgi:hypothetical protein
MLSDEARARIRGAGRPALVEIAGRDSVAAALRACAERGYDVLLPTIAFTGTEFGDRSIPFEKLELLPGLLTAAGVEAEVLPPVLVGAPRLWRFLCGRYVYEMYMRFGFYTPCPGCHLYLHAIRVPLALELGCRTVIAGERESHDGRVKLNQIAEALDAYVEFAGRFGVELHLPLRDVTSGREIEEIVGPGWREGEGQLECVLSGNYGDAAGEVNYDGDAVGRFFKEFAVPAATQAVEAYVAGREPAYGEIVRGIWPKS